ncbi:hypothetical protein Tco_0108244, partial [Tanacetum coccineum]
CASEVTCWSCVESGGWDCGLTYLALYSSHHSGANVAEAEVDSVVRSFAPAIATITTVTATVDVATVAKEAPIKPSLFGVGSSSAGGTDSAPGGFSDVSGSEFLIGGICIVVDPDFGLQKVYVPQWSVTNGSRLDDQLFTEFNVGSTCQISLSAEVRMRAEYNIKEKRRLRSVVDEQTELLKVRDGEIENLKAQLLLKEAEAAEAIRLRAEASDIYVKYGQKQSKTDKTEHGNGRVQEIEVED